jgi:uncharacterized protein
MLTQLPTPVAIEFLHRQTAGNAERFELVFTHCQIVWAIAEQLITSYQLEVDAELVRVGALLHDIGVYVLEPNEPYIRHGAVGAWMLQKNGYPDSLCRFASCHTGVGLSRHDIEAEHLPLPPADFTAKTPEERLVMYADKYHSKTVPPRFNSVGSIQKELGKYGEDKIERFKQLMAEFGVPDLKALAQEFGNKLI